jgi:hypothetical protein
MRRWRAITDWQSLAVEMYFRRYGRRCVRCSKIVEAKDALLHKDGTEIVLTHVRCKR